MRSICHYHIWQDAVEKAQISVSDRGDGHISWVASVERRADRSEFETSGELPRDQRLEAERAARAALATVVPSAALVEIYREQQWLEGTSTDIGMILIRHNGETVRWKAWNHTDPIMARARAKCHLKFSSSRACDRRNSG